MKKLIFCLLCISSFADIKRLKSLYKDGLYLDAAREAEDFLKVNTNPKKKNTALYYLALSYKQQKFYDRALMSFAKMDRGDLREEALYHTAMIHLEQDAPKSALSTMERISSASSAKSEAKFQIAEYFYSKNNFKSAAKLYKEIISDRSNRYKDAILRMGLLSFKQDKHVDAISFLEAYLMEEGALSEEKRGAALYRLALANEKLGYLKESKSYHQKITNSLSNTEYYGHSLNALIKMNLKEPAEDLTRIVKQAKNHFLNRENESGLLEMISLVEDVNIDLALDIASVNLPFDSLKRKKARLYIKKGDNKKALEVVKWLDDDESTYLKAFALYAMKNYKGVINLNVLSKISESSLFYNEAVLKLGWTYLGLKDYDKADQYFSSLPQSGEGCYGLLLTKEGKEDKEILGLLKSYSKINSNQELDKSFYSKAISYALKSEDNEAAYLAAKNLLKRVKSDDSLKKMISMLIDIKKYKDILHYAGQLSKKKERLFFEGVARLNMHEYAAAIETFKQSLNDRNLGAESAFYLIDAYLSMNNYSEAIKYANIYIKKGYKKDLIKVMERKGIALFRLKKYGEAIKLYESMLEAGADKDVTHFRMADVYYNLRDYDRAFEMYKQLFDNESEYREKAFYSAAIILYNKKDYDKGADVINQALSHYPNSKYEEELYQMLGEMRLAQGEIAKAVLNYERFLTLVSEERQEETIVRLALHFAKTGRVNVSEKFVAKLINQDKKEIELGKLEYRAGKVDAALARYESIVDTKYSDEANYLLGEHYLAGKRDVDKSIEYMDKVLQDRDSKFKHRALFKKAMGYFDKKDYKRSVIILNSLKQVYHSDDLQEQVYLKLAEAYDKLNEKESSINVYKEFLKKYNGSKYQVSVLEKLVIYYINTSQKSEAAQYLKELEKRDVQVAKKYESSVK